MLVEDGAQEGAQAARHVAAGHQQVTQRMAADGGALLQRRVGAQQPERLRHEQFQRQRRQPLHVALPPRRRRLAFALKKSNKKKKNTVSGSRAIPLAGDVSRTKDYTYLKTSALLCRIESHQCNYGRVVLFRRTVTIPHKYKMCYRRL